MQKKASGNTAEETAYVVDVQIHHFTWKSAEKRGSSQYL